MWILQGGASYPPLPSTSWTGMAWSCSAAVLGLKVKAGVLWQTCRPVMAAARSFAPPPYLVSAGINSLGHGQQTATAKAAAMRAVERDVLRANHIQQDA